MKVEGWSAAESEYADAVCLYAFVLRNIYNEALLSSKNDRGFHWRTTQAFIGEMTRLSSKNDIGFHGRTT